MPELNEKHKHYRIVESKIGGNNKSLTTRKANLDSLESFHIESVEKHCQFSMTSAKNTHLRRTFALDSHKMHRLPT